MKTITILLALILSLNANMTKPCERLAKKIGQQAPIYNELIENKEYPLAHVIITRLVTNMSWIETECNKNNPYDAELIRGVYKHFDIYYNEKQALDKKYGKIEYMYEKD